MKTQPKDKSLSRKKPLLNAEFFVVDIMNRLAANKRVTGIHRIALGTALMHSVGIEARFVASPKVRLLRAGKLVRIDCVHAKRACAFPEEGNMIGMLERVIDGIAVVKVRHDCYITVGMNVLTEV